MKNSLFLMTLGVLLLVGCALQQDVSSLNNHLMVLSQQNAKLEQRITEFDQHLTALEQRITELNSQLNTLKQRDVELEQHSNSALTEQSAQMESQIENIQKRQDQTTQQLRDQLAGLRVMLTDIRQEMQALSGKSEVSEHMLKQKTKAAEDLERKLESRLSFLEEQSSRLEEQSSRYEERTKRLEEYLNFESSRGKITKEGAEGLAAKELSDDELYSRAKQLFDKGDYEAARKGFQDLLDRFPKSQNADNAQFWIGEIYYREKWYEKAILEYQKVLENYPQGNKVPASLLKQGYAFVNIGDKANARLILRELMNKYPESNEAKIAGKKLDELK